jgi:hypothetical protein
VRASQTTMRSACVALHQASAPSAAPADRHRNSSLYERCNEREGENDLGNDLAVGVIEERKTSERAASERNRKQTDPQRPAEDQHRC